MSALPPPPTADQPIRRRHLFYISGFDPRSPGIYHAMYRDESAKQAAVMGGSRSVGPVERIGQAAVGWEVTDASGALTRYEVLRWDDLVRTHWHGNDGALLRDAAVMYLDALGRGHLWKLLRLTPWTGFTVVYPGLSVVAMSLLAVLAATMAGWSVADYGMAVVVATAGITLAAVLLFGRKLLRVIKSDWLLRILIFLRRHGQQAPAAVEERIESFARRLREALDDPACDEVLVVGHSIGAQLAVSAMARARALPAAHESQATASLLTLGGCIPLAAWWPGSAPLRRDLAALAADPTVTWVDVTSLPDGACMAQVDPVGASGVPGTGKPFLLPARFHRQFSPARYRSLKRNRFRLHFQYIMAAEQAGGFDYFAVSAGPRPLSALIAVKDPVHVAE